MAGERGRRVVRISLLGVLGVGVLWFVLTLPSVFGPLLFALLIAYILNPVVNRLQHRWLPRSAAIGILFLTFYACLSGVLVVTVPALVTQIQTLYENTVGEQTVTVAEYQRISKQPEEQIGPESGMASPSGWLRLPGEGGAFFDANGNGHYDQGYLRELAHWIERAKRERNPSATKRVVARALEEIRDYFVANRRGAMLTAVDTLVGALFTFFGILTTFVLVPIYLFYFLMGLSSMWDRLVASLPGRHRGRIVHVLHRIDEAVSAFFRGRLIVMVIKAVIAGLALTVAGLPYALFLGLVTGVGSLIPIAGFVIGMLAGVAIALLDAGSTSLALVVLLIYIVLEIFENYLLTPWILRDRVGLHPVAIVVSVFAAGAVFGFVGMLLAVPITAVVKILYEEFVRPEIALLAAEE